MLCPHGNLLDVIAFWVGVNIEFTLGQKIEQPGDGSNYGHCIETSQEKHASVYGVK